MSGFSANPPREESMSGFGRPESPPSPPKANGAGSNWQLSANARSTAPPAVPGSLRLPERTRPIERCPTRHPQAAFGTDPQRRHLSTETTRTGNSRGPKDTTHLPAASRPPGTQSPVERRMRVPGSLPDSGLPTVANSTRRSPLSPRRTPLSPPPLRQLRPPSPAIARLTSHRFFPPTKGIVADCFIHAVNLRSSRSSTEETSTPRVVLPIPIGVTGGSG